MSIKHTFGNFMLLIKYPLICFCVSTKNEMKKNYIRLYCIWFFTWFLYKWYVGYTSDSGLLDDKNVI